MPSLLTAQSAPQGSGSLLLDSIFFIAVTAIVMLARRWYKRPSGIPEPLTASYSHQTLEFMRSYAERENEDPEKYELSRQDVITPYMEGRGLAWRQRNDIIRYMKKVNWIYERRKDGYEYYVFSKQGKWELETADGLRGVAEEAAWTLHGVGISGDRAKVEAAAILAAALRVYAHTAPGEGRTRAKDSAIEIEDAVKARDPGNIDRGITRTKDLLQIVTYALPFVRDILRFLGLP